MLAAIAVAVGGAFGALARYGADRFIEHRAQSVFPWSTFVINLTGCFLAGLAVAAIVNRHHAPSWLGLGVVTGFLGAYTTYSMFAQETYELGGSYPGVAVVNVVATVTVGLTEIWAGGAVGRHF